MNYTCIKQHDITDNFVVLCITVVVSSYTVIRLYKNGFTFFKK